MTEKVVDILIVGGGIVGAAMMHALQPLGYRVLLVDARPACGEESSQDARCLTLSFSSIQLFTTLNLWSKLSPYATPIERIHVSAQGDFGRACLQAPPERPLGVVIPITRLRHALCADFTPEQYWSSAQLTQFEVSTQTASIQTAQGLYQVRASLVIAADGADSDLRRYCNLPVTVKDYAQQALVVNVSLARAHQHWAYERFTASGLLALLPQPGLRAGLVWVASLSETTQALACSEADFLHKLQQAFGYRLGRFTQIGRREAFPLRQVLMPKQVMGGVVFIGNAAHTIHPVAGQGFNLGLRDVAMLAQCIHQAGASPDSLQTYQQMRKRDQQAIIDLTDGLTRLYRHPSRTLRLARQLGLVLFDNTPALKKVVSRYASGLGGVVPDLVCGIPFGDA